MPRCLDAVYPGGGYVEETAVKESDLERIVAMLGIEEPETRAVARQQIIAALEDFITAQCRVVHARPTGEDREALQDLLKRTSTKLEAGSPGEVIEALRALEKANAVLYQRIKWAVGASRLREWRASLQAGASTSVEILRGLSAAASALRDEVASEDSRGRPSNSEARKLASALSGIWVEFTGRGTSRQNAPDRQKDPFGDFVDAVGKLVDPAFKGHYLARQVHEARRRPPSGEK